MSGLVAAFGSRTGVRVAEPPGKTALDRIAQGLQHRGAVGAIEQAGTAELYALGSAAIYRSGDFTILIDGHIDPSPLNARAPDLAAAMVSILRARGPLALGESLYGDFALLIFDEREHTLYAYRDALGLVGLYFVRAGRETYFSTEPGALTRAPGLTPTPDKTSIAQLFLREFAESTTSLHEGIAPVPPGHVLIASDRSTTLKPYLRLDAIPERSLNAEDAEREVRSHLTASIQQACASESQIAVEISGGLDSSFVAALLVEQRPREQLVGLTTTFPKELGCDESPAAEAVARAIGIRWVPSQAPLDPFSHSPLAPDLLFHPALHMFTPSLQEANSRGISRVLTGHGADALFFQTGLEWLDAVKHRNIHGMLSTQPPFRNLRSVARAAAQRLGVVAPRLPSWLSRDAQARILAAREGQRPASSREALWRLLTGSYDTQFGNACADRFAAREGLSYAHPYLDRRMAELVLGLPPGVRAPRGNKTLLRAAAKGSNLPESVRTQVQTAEFSPYVAAILEASRPLVAGFIAAPRVGDLGLVDVPAVRKAYADGTLGLGPLVSISSVELWLRHWF